jgi:transcriptional regulator with XRE-family HTH domain
VASSLGEQLRALRKRRRWSQADLAVQLDVSKANVCHYEKNLRYPRHEVLLEIAKLLRKAVGRLYQETAGRVA